MKTIKFLFFAVLVAFSTMSANAALLINEIMQSNVDCYMENKEFPDSWVELYNNGSSAEQLSYYRLGTTRNSTEAYKFTSSQVAAKGRILIFCDKKSTGLHTNFALETGKGCTLYLFEGTQIVDSLPYALKKQPAPNIAFGRKTDGSQYWGYQLTPTPGKANTGEICLRDQILSDPEFSIDGRVFKKGESFKVEISLPADSPADAELRYTTNGSEPTSGSALYTGPIEISATIVLRVKPFCKGWLSPRSSVQSYIQIDRDVTMPVISMVTDSKYFFDSSIGIYANTDNPAANWWEGSKKNYELEWNRPVNVELFEEDALEESVINQLCETRVSGAWTRKFPLKTLAVNAHSRFGTKHFRYEFFPDQRPGIDDYKSVLFRNAGNDFEYTYMRDAAMQSHLAAHTDVDYQAYRPAIFFLNGVYKGMVHIRERSNEDNIYSNYNGLEAIDMVENWSELKTGRKSVWDSFTKFYESKGHSYAEYEKLMDIQEFMDVMIFNIIHCNLDFPGNNFVMWRPQADGGLWRVQVKDIDYCLGIYTRPTDTANEIYNIPVDYNIFPWIHRDDNNKSWQNEAHYTWGNSQNGTKLFRRLMDTPEFKKEFIDRMAVYMGDFLGYEQTLEVCDSVAAKIEYEYRYHRELYKQPWDDYLNELDKMESWLQSRIPIVYKQMASYYKLGAATPLFVYADSELDEPLAQQTFGLTFNGVRLVKAMFDGMFFAGRQITLSAHDAVTGWKITTTTDKGDNVSVTNGTTLLYEIPSSAKGVQIVALTSTSKVEETIGGEELSKEVYDINGVRKDGLSRGVNLIRLSDGRVVKKLVP